MVRVLIDHYTPSPALAPIESVVTSGQGVQTALHTHPCGQLLYLSVGTALLEIQGAMIRMSPDRGAWIPAGAQHATFMDRSYRYQSLYIADAFYHCDQFRVFSVSSLLRELIIDVSTWTRQPTASDATIRKSHVIVDELKRASELETALPMPDDDRIMQICRRLIEDPANKEPLSYWADQIGASEKTIQRLFLKTTGLSYQQWRNHLKMTKGLALQAEGARIIDVALSLGYSTEGAYAYAFKKFYGFPPGQFRREQRVSTPHSGTGF